MPNLNIAALQTQQFWEDKAKNLAHFDTLLSHYDLDEIDVLVFPEMFHTGFSMNPEKLYEEMNNAMGIEWLQKKSEQYNCLCIASLIIRENMQYFNRMVAIYPDGKIEYYDKRYLFSFAGEHEVYTAGKTQKIIQYKGWNILLQVCFDLRFPEGARNYMINQSNASYDFVIYVANWPQKRIQHWQALLKARAIENQAYVVGVNRVGIDGNQHEYNGKSQIISPFGKIVAEAKDNEEQVIVASIEADTITEIRQKMNFLNDIKS